VPAQCAADLDLVRRRDAAENLDESSFGLEEMNIGIPQRVVSVENQVQAVCTRICEHHEERSPAVGRSAITLEMIIATSG
jgi:hypothetical protein